jgi:nitroimidazol reductase NimA-like FMN-containing flavoprotein (pyridoxamine 5'-phosphate oxidase superfamily)
MTEKGRTLSSEPLTRDECLQLLADADLARIVMSVRALPAALPTRISLSGDDHLILASDEDSVIIAMRRGDVISVQIDGLETDGSVWSVMASGIATASAGDETLRPAIREALDNGATLLTLPLTVVSGKRSS